MLKLQIYDYNYSSIDDAVVVQNLSAAAIKLGPCRCPKATISCVSNSNLIYLLSYSTKKVQTVA